MTEKGSIEDAECPSIFGESGNLDQLAGGEKFGQNFWGSLKSNK